MTGDGHPISRDVAEPKIGPTSASGVSSTNRGTRSRWRWLESTRVLQEEAFGKSFDGTFDPDDFADSIVMNHSALVVELSEFMQEVGWKDWATPRGWVNRDAAVGELVDAAHFLANILVRLDVTDDEWERRYREKQEVNRRRQAGEYTGRHKCPGCQRSYDDVGVACRDQEPLVNFSGDGIERFAPAWCAVTRQSY